MGLCRNFFRLPASHFLVLVPQKVTKEEDTQPSRPAAPLRCSTKWASIETRPSGLHTPQATAELEQPMADYSHFVSATQRDGMGFISLKEQRRSLDGKKQILFLQFANGCSRMVFGAPICRAEQRRIGGSCRPSAVRVPQQATMCVACQGEFRWTPDKPSSAGNKRRLGCISFGYLFFVQAKKSDSPKGRKNIP